MEKSVTQKAEDCKLVRDCNTDGQYSAEYTIPKKWVKVNAGSLNKRVLTEEQKEAARERLMKIQPWKKKANGNMN